MPSLRSVRLVRELERSFAAAFERGRFRLVHYSIQNDHLHLVVEADDRRALSRGMKGLLVRAARALNRLWRRRGPVFGDRYHLHVLRSPREAHHALAYVLNNARKHVRHIGHVAYSDVTSSGESFDGWTEPVTMYRSLGDDTEPWTQVRAWTWLARVGWRKRGLISPFAVPGGKPPT